MKRIMFIAAVALAACNSDPTHHELPGGHDHQGIDGKVEPLSCESYSLDATAATARFYGQEMPVLSGGKIAEGLYRRMYTRSNEPAPQINGTTEPMDANEEADAILFANGRVLWMRGEGAVGKYEARNTTLKFDFEESCNTVTGEAVDSPASDESFTYGVDSSGQLSLRGSYTIEGETFEFVSVYGKTDDLCENGNEQTFPSKMGTDSWHCAPENLGGFSACTCKVDGEYAISSGD